MQCVTVTFYLSAYKHTKLSGSILMRGRSYPAASPAIYVEKKGCRAAVDQEHCPIMDDRDPMNFMVLNAKD